MDDLCSWEEFEMLVRDRIESSGGGHDERSAAIEIVSGEGRLHTPISGLKRGPSLVSFFCRVIEVSGPVRFERADGGHGFVSKILCGDETGEVILTLWDDKAFASSEISPGEVLEVAGRLKRPGYISVSDLIKPDNFGEMPLRETGMRTMCSVTADMKILAFAGSGSFSSGTGRRSGYTRIIGGDASGTAEIMFWNGDLIKSCREGEFIRIGNMHEKPASGMKRHFSVGEDAWIEHLDACRCENIFTGKIRDLYDGWSGSVSAVVDDPGEVRGYVTRTGRPSLVRNVSISDDSGKAMLVIWGDQAGRFLSERDTLNIFFADARERSGGPGYDENVSKFEIHAGHGSFVFPEEKGGKEFSIKGILAPRKGYMSIETGELCYPLKDRKEGMKVCAGVDARGILYDSGRFEAGEWGHISEDPVGLREETDRLKEKLGC